jgi:hypothetical protein
MQAIEILDSDLIPFVEMIFKAKKTPHIKGRPGSGKSKQIEAYARRMNKKYADDGGYGFFVLDLSKANIADFNGFLMPEKETVIDHAGNPVEIMAGKYTMPFFCYDLFTGRPIQSFKRGCIVLEEWAQGEGEVKRACAPLIYDRRIGLWQFPDFDVIMLGNTGKDRSGETKEYDFIINRTVEVTLKPTLANFLVVATELGMTPITMAFAKRNEMDLFYGEKPKEQGPHLTQRSLHALDDIIKVAMADRSLDDPLISIAASATIGFGHGQIYMALIKARNEIPTISEVLANPLGCRIPEKLDMLTFLVFDLASKAKRENMPQLAQYINRLSTDMGASFFNAVTQRDEQLVFTREFSQFSQKNITLMSAAALRKATMQRGAA